VEPTVGPDSYTIELRLAPRVIEFDGFINYGSPIYASVQYSTPLLTLPSATFEATPNTINQPVFSTREVETQVSVYDGQTVVMGGLDARGCSKSSRQSAALG
jgi:general secretion pathway protein D